MERNYPWVSLGLAATAIIYYFFISKSGRMMSAAYEYFSFMALIGSLFVISGGIHIKIKGRSTPLTNTILLAVGAVMANFLGTTGLLNGSLSGLYQEQQIQNFCLPHHLLRIHRLEHRRHADAGGRSTPLSRLFEGCPFFLGLITRIWPIWALATGVVLLTFYLVDRHNFRKFPPPSNVTWRKAENMCASAAWSTFFFSSLFSGPSSFRDHTQGDGHALLRLRQPDHDAPGYP